MKYPSWIGIPCFSLACITFMLTFNHHNCQNFTKHFDHVTNASVILPSHLMKQVILLFCCVHYAITYHSTTNCCLHPLQHKNNNMKKVHFIEDWGYASINNLTNIPFLFQYSFMQRERISFDKKVCSQHSFIFLMPCSSCSYMQDIWQA